MKASKGPAVDQLVDEYKTLPQYCENVNYSDPAAIKKNNHSVKRMVKIVRAVCKFGPAGIHKLLPLLEIEQHKTNLWIATHLLEEVEVDEKLEEKALEIIKRVSATDPVLKIGYEHWLKLYFGEEEKIS